MSNILNHNNILIDFILSEEDYWDFHLAQEVGYRGIPSGLTTECLAAYIDFNDPNCVMWEHAFSKNEFIWKDAINDGVLMDYIGTTGVDNGFISYQKDRITNKEFLNIFLNSSFDTSNGDMRLHLRKINGNNQIYDYSNDIVFEDGKDVARLNGGFYQGFFKVYEKRYQVLPYVLENGWSMEVKLKKSDLENENSTLNDTHPENKGMFLYIGTRAENKWWQRYLVEPSFEPSPLNYHNDDYASNEYVSEDGNVNAPYSDMEYDYLEMVYNNDGEHCEKLKGGNYVKDGYADDRYLKLSDDKYNPYATEDYLERDTHIEGNEKILTADGIDFDQPNVTKFETDNKFLLFNRTKEGFTTKTWEEGAKATFYDIKKPNIENYHIIFNRTPNGYTTKTIGNLLEVENKRYNVLKDLYRNAIGFQIKDDGSIGFKYLVKDCELEEEGYKIEQLFTDGGVIKNDEWYTISIKIIPDTPKNIDSPTCDNITTSSDKKMTVYIYVNGKLKLKSEPLPMLNIKQLDDLSDKQQGVPYSISLGGGTQGLCDVININYRETPRYLLPLEKEFGGSFVGYIQSFRFYECPLNLTEIKENYLFDTNI